MDSKNIAAAVGVTMLVAACATPVTLPHPARSERDTTAAPPRTSGGASEIESPSIRALEAERRALQEQELAARASVAKATALRRKGDVVLVGSAKYDRLEDQHSVSSDTFRIWSDVGEVDAFGKRNYEAVLMGVVFAGSGRRVTEPSAVFLTFQRHANEWSWLKEPRTVLLIAGERRVVPSPESDTDHAGGDVTETLFIPLSLADAEVLAAGASLEGRVGEIEFVAPTDFAASVARCLAHVGTDAHVAD